MEVKDELKKLNYKHAVKIRCQTAKKSGSFYLEYNSNYKRVYEYLKLYITGSYQRDKETLKLVQTIRDKREYEITMNNAGMEALLMKDVKLLLSDYSAKILQDKTTRTREFYASGINSLIHQAGDKYLSNYTEDLIKNWLNNLQHSKVTVHNYLRAVKYVFKSALKEKMIKTNPCEDLHLRFPDTKREFLTYREIQKVAAVHFDTPAIQDAFLFSCYTGLRLGDIRSLLWSNIVNGYLEHTQHKTGHVERMKLHEEALRIIERQPRLTPYVFNLHAQKRFYMHFKRFMAQTGITKRITFHCARHTFATWLLTNDVDLYTVSKLLGHRDVTTTQIYAKLIDKKKDEAIDKLQMLNTDEQNIPK